MVRITVEFSGGMDLLFGGVKEAEITLSGSSERSLTIADVIVHCRDKMLKDRPELFVKGDSVRPGILVLLNEADWELLGTTEAELEDGDRVTFISTLHGG